MTTNPLFHKQNAGNAKLPKKIQEEIQESLSLTENEINITDGGEFLDDDLRMKDQPLDETTEKQD